MSGSRVNGSKTTNTINAKKRLLRDLKELQECDELLETVNAEPEEQNFFVWHCNLRPKEGPFRGSVFHIIMEFPDNYPVSPPGVLLMTSFGHPNVYSSNMADFRFKHITDLATSRGHGGQRFFGRHICLDILKNYTTKDAYAGWSRAYSVASILLQLQSFLFAENVPQGYGTTNNSGLSSTSGVRKRNLEFKCPRAGCSHTGHTPSPALCPVATRRRLVIGQAKEACFYDGKINYRPIARQIPVAGGRVLGRPGQQQRRKDHTRWARSVFQNDLLVNEIMAFLNTQDVLKCKHASPSLCHIIERYNICGRREVKCFFSKETYLDTTLGVGLQVERFENRVDQVTGINGHGRPKTMTSQMDYLSWGAYEQGIRSGVWGGSFNEFIPLIVSKRHGERVYKLLCESIFTLTTPPRADKAVIKLTEKKLGLLPRSNEFADRALDVLGCLMNSMAVSMVDTHPTPKQPTDPYSFMYGGHKPVTVSVSLCEKAVLGYCSFHHTLLFMAEKFPRIRQRANQRVRAFKANMAARHKANTRDLGKFLVHLCLSDLGWEAIRDEFCLEAGARSVLWATRKDECLNSIPKARHELDYKPKPEPQSMRSDGPFPYLLVRGTRVIAAWNDANGGKIGRYDLRNVAEMPFYEAIVTQSGHYSYDAYGVMVRFTDPGYNQREFFRRLDGECVKPMPKSTRATVSLSKKLFDASIVGKRLTMFQIYFLLHIGRPAGKSPQDILRMYNERLGRPTLDMTRKVTAAAKTIMKVQGWNEYFQMIGMDRSKCNKTESQLLKQAKISFKNATHFGYRGSASFRKQQQSNCLRESRPTTRVQTVPCDLWWRQDYCNSQVQAMGRVLRPTKPAHAPAPAANAPQTRTRAVPLSHKPAKASQKLTATAATAVAAKSVPTTVSASPTKRTFRVLSPKGVSYRASRDLHDRVIDAVARKNDVVRCSKVVKENNVIWAWVDIASLWLPLRLLDATPEPLLVEEILTARLSSMGITARLSSITAPDAAPTVSKPEVVAATETPADDRSQSTEAAVVSVENASAVRTYCVEAPNGVSYRSSRDVAARCPGLAAKNGEFVSGSEVVQEGNVTWLRVIGGRTAIAPDRWLPVQAGDTVLAREVVEEPAQTMPPTPEVESVGLVERSNTSSPAPAAAPTEKAFSLPSLLPPLPNYNRRVDALGPAEEVPDVCVSRSASPWAPPTQMAAEMVFTESPLLKAITDVPKDVQLGSLNRGWSAPREQQWDQTESQFDTFHVIVPAHIAHRRSRNLGDRMDSVARYGSTVTGMVDGDWLRMSGAEERWLPISVRGHRLLAVL